MLQVVNEPILNILPRLVSTDISFDVSKVRLQEISNDFTLIFFDDFDKLNESNIASVILHYNLNPDKVGLVIDEVKIIKDPYIYKKAKHIINPSKVYIRPIHTHHLNRMVENSIQEYIETNSWESFDKIMNFPFTLAETAGHWVRQRIMATTIPLQDKMKERIQNTKERWKAGGKKYTKTAAMVGGGLAATYLASDHLTKSYANDDYVTHPFERSQLIARLRTLVGKSAAYESEYERANEARKGILRRILDKIKSTIRAIKNKLFGNNSTDINNTMGRY